SPTWRLIAFRMARYRLSAVHCFVRSRRRRIRGGTEVSASCRVSFSLAILGTDRICPRVGYDRFHPEENGSGRNVRPSGRRLSPLLGRCTLARAALRKNAVY